MAARISFLIFITLFLVLVDVYLVRAAWLYWRHPDRAPRLTLTKSSDPSVIRGHERGVVPFAAGFVLLTVMMCDGVLVTSRPEIPGPLAAVGVVVGAVGFLLGLLLHATVVWFNWPGFLVPPDLRGDTGVFVERVRHRRDLTAALREAADREARRS